ncbi:hypothetical protein P8C59_001444 [Phyllachora maydis]|uniref:Uncharacterized protein n=1 Tax=Phyllachora maydis TaxID=1825666 RepID=A0AAD9HYE8_9PEZI|nr:hypothetical protein P8C59_001444 [Phyllachora maydis]
MSPSDEMFLPGRCHLRTTAEKKPALPKSSMQIDIFHHYSAKVYTSSSSVTGIVAITTRRDVHFDAIHVLLLGLTTTRVEGANSPSLVSHAFLKLSMPPASYAAFPTLKAGVPYKFPFHFVIPDQLTLNGCNHGIVHGIVGDRLREQHLRLPPSVGGFEKDDLAPLMAEVKYSVLARVLRRPEPNGKLVKIMESSRRIQVLPVSFTDDPIDPSPQDKLYRTAKAKTLRRNLLAGKLGRLTARAPQQPGPVYVATDGRAASETAAEVILEFEPSVQGVGPPNLSGVSGKVVAHTFYSGAMVACFPDRADWMRHGVTEQRGAFATSVALPSVADGTRGQQRRWEKSCSSPPSSSSSPALLLHTMTLRLPVRLPTAKKTFIPTFHSCIASRVYTLQVAITMSAAGSAGSTTLTLSLPLQVAVEGPAAGADAEQLPSFETAVEGAAADEYLRPRTLQASASLPGYEDVVRATEVVV